MRLRPAQAKALGIDIGHAPRGNKFGAVKTRGFDSRKEADRWLELTCLEKAREITELRYKPVFLLFAGARFLGKYSADSCYRVNGELVVEDVKGGKSTRTEAYMLRRRMVRELYGITIHEV